MSSIVFIGSLYFIGKTLWSAFSPLLSWIICSFVIYCFDFDFFIYPESLSPTQSITDEDIPPPPANLVFCTRQVSRGIELAECVL